MARPPPPPLPTFSYEVASSIGHRVRHGSSAATSGAVRCDIFASHLTLGSQPSLEATWNMEKIQEARKACANFWDVSDIPFN